MHVQVDVEVVKLALKISHRSHLRVGWLIALGTASAECQQCLPVVVKVVGRRRYRLVASERGQQGVSLFKRTFNNVGQRHQWVGHLSGIGGDEAGGGFCPA